MAGRSNAARSAREKRQRRTEAKRQPSTPPKAVREAAALKATDFRLRHSPVDGAPPVEAIAPVLDSDGHIGKPAYRTLDTLRALHKTGSIEDDQLAAGLAFQETFLMAHYDASRAADLCRIPGAFAEPELTEAARSARDDVRAVISDLGGPSAPIALALWWVVGYGLTVKQFATREAFGRRRSMNPMAATALVSGALSVLAARAEKQARS